MKVKSIGCCEVVTQAQLQKVKDAVEALGGNTVDTDNTATGNVVFENGRLYNVLEDGTKVLIPIYAEGLNGESIPLGVDEN